ncbi:MAG: cytochrome-c oxidase, cbb3-type subunit III [Ectothiorhodospira sp.]
MSEPRRPGPPPAGERKPPTTGHVWDSDLQEHDNPLPRWWVWGFYATVVFAVVYWLLYPAWPVADSYTPGLARITYEADGESRTTHWNSRALLLQEMQEGETARRRQDYLQVIAESPWERILSDPGMLDFVRAYGRGAFGEYCAACHQSGGAGLVGLYPNLADDNWHWGGDPETIRRTIAGGRLGFMPPFDHALDADQRRAVAAYVLQLSGVPGDTAQVARGRELFQGPEGGCYTCHRPDGTGVRSLGAPDLTNGIWSNIDVVGAPDGAARIERVSAFIARGVRREMPAFGERLSEAEIRVLAAYVHQLGGGQ